MLNKFAYGDACLDVEIPEHNVAACLKSAEAASDGSNRDIIRQALENPCGSSRISAIVKAKSAQSAVIVVNDITRPTPYKYILPPLLKEIEAAGIVRQNIKMVVALGIHRPHSEAENKAIFGEGICSRYTIQNHDCDNNLASIGQLSNGMELIINRTVAEADLLITTGVVGLHYFAGYSGGRKSILPGVAARSVIEKNHQMMSDPRACLGNYENNPVSDLMLEAARLAGVDFILNVVTAGKDKIAFAAAGDVYQAWLAAVQYCEKMSVVTIPEPADIVIASCGGYPKDINMYQAQKALEAASPAVKEGGTILLLAECREGLGEASFARWLNDAASPKDIEQRFFNSFELGGHKAYALCRTLRRADVLLYSALADETVRKMFITPIHDLQTAVDQLRLKYGSRARMVLMPEAPRIAVKVRPFE
ncbi:nickel-dependent lactate racemase [Syntrophomonas curvata]